jgi:hypothetical protein
MPLLLLARLPAWAPKPVLAIRFCITLTARLVRVRRFAARAASASGRQRAADVNEVAGRSGRDPDLVAVVDPDPGGQLVADRDQAPVSGQAAVGGGGPDPVNPGRGADHHHDGRHQQQ